MRLRSGRRGPANPTAGSAEAGPAQQDPVQEQPAQNIQQATAQHLTPECSVCTVQPINRVFIPCGHSFCNFCTERRMPGETCFVCRTPVASVFPLFF